MIAEPKAVLSDVHPANPHRRKFLVTSLFGTSALLLGVSTNNHAWQLPTAGTATTAPEGFLSISRLLTGHAIDESLVDRAWGAINAREHDFAARFATLQSAIKKANLTDLQAWDASPIAADGNLKSTALAIVSAWYLGLVGPVKDRAEDGPNFITYEGALMWRPTLDVTVIPTYSRGAPGFWQEKPPSVATD